MNAHNFTSIYNLIGNGDPDPVAWYKSLFVRTSAIPGLNKVMDAQTEVEHNWYREGRPYYTVYPVAAASLEKVPLDVPCESVKLPRNGLLIRFMEGHEPQGIRSIIVSHIISHMGDHVPVRGLSVWADTGERQPADFDFNGKPSNITVPVFDFVTFPLLPERTVREQIELMLKEGTGAFKQAVDPVDRAVILTAVQFVVAVSLLADDPTLITPDVLSKDRLKYEQTKNPEIVARAIRRGKLGWLVGADWETIPHYRRPHFAIRWTEKGRSVPKLVPVKGAIVHREKLSEVPQGYLDT